MIKCSKCGSESEDGAKFCTKCGEKLTSGSSAGENFSGKPDFSGLERNSTAVQELISSTEKTGKSSGAIYWILAIIVLALSIYASFKIAAAGSEIAFIQSIGGRTLEEAYYKEMGNVYKGFSAVILAMGIFFSAVLAKLGKSK